MALPDELVRVVRTADGGLQVSRHGPGRGAWLCDGRPGCLDRAIRKRAFAKALRADVSAEATEVLRRILANRARMGTPSIQ